MLWCVGNLERIQIRAVNAPIVAHSEFVTALDVTAPANGCDSPIGQDGVDEVFHCPWCWVKP